jgi:hypothetical protein
MEEDNKNLKLNLEKSLRTQEVMKKQQEETNKQLFSTLSKIEKLLEKEKNTKKLGEKKDEEVEDENDGENTTVLAA